ncbi:hypothetical protein ACTWQF_24400 [Streptomyces sp. 8N114]|uniref:hypothetical protein n=1 Tax=Streptomyces sp. 8N114 TaxID=3457419 RepID=UPI003FD41EEE
MSQKLRKAVVAAATLSFAAVLSAGCSSGDDSPREGVREKTGGKRASEIARPSQPPLGKAELRRALLHKGEVEGVDVEPVPGDEAAARLALTGPGAKPAGCAPLAHMAAHTSVPAPKSRGVVTTSRKDGLTTSVGLMGHQAGDATKIVAKVRAAVKKCADGFRDEVGSYRDVVALPDPTEGDEGVSYSLKSTVDGERMPLTFTVVRSGSTLAVFFGTNLIEPDKTEPAPEVMRAQLAKLPD